MLINTFTIFPFTKHFFKLFQLGNKDWWQSKQLIAIFRQGISLIFYIFILRDNWSI